ncbi:DUF2777 domain-containing protein [Metabacillus litoralis]|uniref:DUF2777 family protein n=1 Tax=Metabacillus TaxID=2675233 RepID=UPI0013CF11C4|nr:DUF2777 family protein [Metabacillus litoralis]MCM3161910.1 DUF2777 domain-containing protein [Metabacillus litoralis]MCM3411183.1 DUF2777 domain-containing protein [Metabacillus litoralis]UHA60311.1 DUF2777 domain-containing protein [Metabacillus litoralis]
MFPIKRTDLLLNQKRSYLTGLIEITNDQYVIYDDMSDELHLLDEIQNSHLEILNPSGWTKGRWIGLGKIKTDMGTLSLNHGDTVRIRKKLPLALDEMLKELQDETFVRLIKQLNSLGFSPYDCIYSYNQLLFMENRVNKKGVSFFQFDNEDSICAIQHHFERGIHSGDRFEITTSLGERRLVCSKF